MNLDAWTEFIDWKPKPSLLPRKVEDVMLSIGWDEVHQSDLSLGRGCPEKLRLTKLGRSTGSLPVVMMLGTVFHRAFDNIDQVRVVGDLPEWWRDQLIIAANERGSTYRLPNGRLVDDEVCWKIAKLFCDRATWGITLKDIILKTHARLIQAGIEILRCEWNLSFKSGRITFDGTLDIFGMFYGKPIILDIKTTGLWSAVLVHFGARNKSIKAQHWKITEVQMHTQLRHYQWMVEAQTDHEVAFYGIVFPTNVIPLKRASGSASAGDDRGPAMINTPVLAPNLGRLYERDMITTITAWTLGGFYRSMPHNYGKPACPTCPAFDACMKNAASNMGSKALADFTASYPVISDDDEI